MLDGKSLRVSSIFRLIETSLTVTLIPERKQGTQQSAQRPSHNEQHSQAAHKNLYLSALTENLNKWRADEVGCMPINSGPRGVRFVLFHIHSRRAAGRI